MTKYLALLRGINVGGKNIIRMSDLKTCFEAMGFLEVMTYIQSGNVLFTSNETDIAILTRDIENRLSQVFTYQSKIVVITQNQLEIAVKNSPENFGMAPDEYRYDVLFLKEPLSPVEAMQSIRLREGVDTAHPGESVIYISRLISRAGQSYLNKVITLPIYQQMTIRNWNTTTKLYSLM